MPNNTDNHWTTPIIIQIITELPNNNIDNHWTIGDNNTYNGCHYGREIIPIINIISSVFYQLCIP